MGQDLSIPHLSPGPAANAAAYKERAEVLRQQFENERTVPPKKPTSWPDPSQVLQEFEQRSRQMELVSTMMGFKVEKGTHAGGVKHHSTTPLEQLRRIELRSMSLRKQHLGRYMLVRVVSRLVKNVGITFIAQEPGGAALQIALYTSPWGFISSAAEVDAILPLGSVFALREPFLKEAGDKSITIRVDSHSDLVFLDEERDLIGLEWKNPVLRPDQCPRVQSADFYKERGNSYLAKKWYIPAERAYSDGLKIDGTNIALRLNRSLAKLKLGLLRSALADANVILALDRSVPTKAQLEKALFRAASACYGLQLWAQAHLLFWELVAIGSDEGEKGLERVYQRLKEVETGEYDWFALWTASQKDPRVDLADYASSSIRVADLKGRGRGIVATKHVKAGELLLMAKPFASCYADECQPLFSINLHNGATESTTHAHLSQKIALRLMEDPSLSDVFDLLYAGPTRPQPPNFSLNKLKPKAEVESRPVDVDMERIELVRTFNAASVTRLTHVLQGGPDADPPGWSEATSRRPAALYALPSMLNHSCVPSGVCGFLGDAVFVRAGRDLREGEEVTISYTPGLAYDARTEILMRYGINCRCQLCVEDRKDKPADRARRQVLIAKLHDLPPPVALSSTPDGFESVHTLFKQRSKLLDDIIRTYADTHDRLYRPELWPAYHNLQDLSALLSRKCSEVEDLLRWAHESRRWQELLLSSCGATSVNATRATYTLPYEHRELCVTSVLLMAATLEVAKDHLGSEEMAIMIEDMWRSREGKSPLFGPFLQRAEAFDAVFCGGGRDLFLERYEGYLKRYGILAIDFK